MNLTLFENDQHLVHGEVSIADSLTAPAGWGTYSIRLPNDQLDKSKLAKIKVILWSCMDRRVIKVLYDKVLQNGYKPQEILTISMGGGPIQEGDERKNAVKSAFAELENSLPNLQKIRAVAHTQGCGGLKHFCGGKLVTESCKPELLNQAKEHGVNGEVYLTDLILGNCLELMPEKLKSKVELAIAIPDEASKTVKIHEHEVKESKKLQEILAQ